MDIDTTLMGPVYGFLAQAAEDPSPEFMRGYELGRLAKHMETLAGRIDAVVHSADVSAVMDCAQRSGWSIELTRLTRGFHNLTAIKRGRGKMRLVSNSDHAA